VSAAFGLVLAADTLSIVTMELVDNAVVLVIPDAMNAGLEDALFWLSTIASLVVAFFAAFPVNRILLMRGKGHALTHGVHGADGHRRRVPSPSTSSLVIGIVAFMLGGLLVAVAG